jgi:uncharacterized protein (TIGR03437 family)
MHRLKIAALSIIPCLAFVCLSDTAQGQSITVNNSSTQQLVTSNSGTVQAAAPLVFNVPAGTSQAITAYQQVLSITTGSGSASLSFVPSPSGNWLYLNSLNAAPNNIQQTGTTPVSLTVAVNTVGFVNGQTTTGSFTICNLAGPPCVQFIVTLNVTAGTGGNGVLTVSPSNSLSFSAIQGTTIASPSSQNIEILTSGSILGYSLSATEQTGGGWITFPNGATGTEDSTQVPIGISSSVLPTLGVGTYTGTVTAIDGANNTVSITVTLTISSGALLTPSPLSFNFLYQVSGTQPAAQTLTVTSNSGSQGFTIRFSPNVSWVGPTNGYSGTATTSVPATIILLATPSGMAPGAYATNLIVTPIGGADLTPIPVKLVISNNPILQLSSSSLTFVAAFAGSSPPSQTVQLTTLGSGSGVGFTALTDTSWLSVSPNAGTATTTAQSLTISVNTTSQPVGTFTGHITVTPTNGDNYTEVITVSLTVGNTAQLTASPSSLLFSYETTKSLPGPQSVEIQSSGQATTFSYTVNPTACNGSSTWLSVVPSGTTTPAQLQINVAAASLTGVCTGTIAVTASGSTTPVNINVTVAVSGPTTPTALLTIAQPLGFGLFNVQQTAAGVSPQTQSLSLNSTDGTGVSYNFNVSSPQNWLFVSSNGGTTPQQLTLQAFPAGLAAGTYGGTLTISSSAGLPATLATPNTFSIPITLIVTPNVTVTASPTALGFNYTSNGPSPATQSLTLTGAGGTASYTASVVNANNCANLINLSPSSGTISPTSTIQVSIGATTSQAGTINCQIALTYVNASTTGTTIPVTLTVASPVTVTVAPTSLSYTYTIGGSQPAAQALTVSSVGGAVPFSVGTTTTGNGNWLSVDTTTGTTAGSGTTLTKVVNVSVSTTGLTGSATGTAYSGTITISSTGVLATPITVAVTLTVLQPPNPQPTVITNSASGVAGVIAPGELITIKGTLMGPATGVSFGLNSQGGVNNSLAGVQVTFDGIPGTPIYVSAAQINVTAPWEIGGRTSSNIVVTYNGNQSAPINVAVNTVAPALFTLNQAGSGQAAALNQNGTYNGPAGGSTIPAPAGTVVVLYATGCGQTSPPGITGSVAPTTQLLQVTAPVSVAFGPLSFPLYGKVTFIGAAPGLVTGVCQINVQLPAGLTSGSQFVTLTVNGLSSVQGPTIAVQ